MASSSLKDEQADFQDGIIFDLGGACHRCVLHGIAEREAHGMQGVKL